MYLRYPVTERLQRDQRPGVAGLGGLLDFAHIARNAGEAEQPALLVEQLVDLRAGEAFLAFEVGDHAGIEIATARAHDQPFTGCEAHGRVHGPAMIHRAERGAIPEVAAHDLQFVHPPLAGVARRGGRPYACELP